MKNLKIVVFDEALKSEEHYDIVYSNISVINLIRDEGGSIDEDIHHDALLSYYVDYYLDQYETGNFSQIVWNSGADYEFFDIVEEGLRKMGAKQHQAFLKKQVALLKSLDYEVLEGFVEADYSATHQTSIALNNDEFFDIEEDVVELNANWLKGHVDLVALSIEDIYVYAENLLGKKIQREEE